MGLVYSVWRNAFFGGYYIIIKQYVFQFSIAIPLSLVVLGLGFYDVGILKKWKRDNLHGDGHGDAHGHGHGHGDGHESKKHDDVKKPEKKKQSAS